MLSFGLSILSLILRVLSWHLLRHGIRRFFVLFKLVEILFLKLSFINGFSKDLIISVLEKFFVVRILLLNFHVFESILPLGIENIIQNLILIHEMKYLIKKLCYKNMFIDIVIFK